MHQTLVYFYSLHFKINKSNAGHNATHKYHSIKMYYNLVLVRFVYFETNNVHFCLHACIASLQLQPGKHSHPGPSPPDSDVTEAS